MRRLFHSWDIGGKALASLGVKYLMWEKEKFGEALKASILRPKTKPLLPIPSVKRWSKVNL